MTGVRMVLLGEAYGRQEAEACAPFVGPSGSLLNKMCSEAGILGSKEGQAAERALWGRRYRERDSIYADAGVRLTNVFNLHPDGNRIEELCGIKQGTRPPLRAGKYLKIEYYPELDRLAEELGQWSPNIVVGLGATALWYATGAGQITKKRGTIMEAPFGKFLATFHPAYLMRGSWALRPIVVTDLIKAERESATAVVARPRRTIYIPESLDDIRDAYRQMERSRTIAIDIETAIGQITCIGFSWEKGSALVVPIWDTSKPGNSYWPCEDEASVWQWVRDICALPIPKVFQNGLYDLHYLWRSYGIPVAACHHDTMLLHHALQPEAQKSLAFLGSLYTDEVSWKQMRGRTTLKKEDA